MNGMMKNSGLLARRLAVAAFALWLCGAGCVMCCAPPVSNAQAQTLAATSAHALSTKKAVSAPSHCAAHARTSRGKAAGDFNLTTEQARTSSSENDHADACCERNGLTSEAARRQSTASERVGDNARTDFSWTDAAAHEACRPAARGRSPDGHATHLRCCVFLI